MNRSFTLTLALVATFLVLLLIVLLTPSILVASSGDPRLLVTLSGLAYYGTFLVAAALLLLAVLHAAGLAPRADPALDILRQRLAAGDISPADFERLRHLLTP